MIQPGRWHGVEPADLARLRRVLALAADFDSPHADLDARWRAEPVATTFAERGRREKNAPSPTTDPGFRMANCIWPLSPIRWTLSAPLSMKKRVLSVAPWSIST